MRHATLLDVRYQLRADEVEASSKTRRARVPGRFPRGEVPEDYAKETDDYEIAQHEWNTEWERRHRASAATARESSGRQRTGRRKRSRGVR